MKETVILFDVGPPLSSDKLFVSCDQCGGGMYVYASAADDDDGDSVEYQCRHLFCVDDE